MILLTRFNGTQFYINAELIQTVEETPNTIITLLDHTKIVVSDPAEVVVERIIEYRKKLYQPLQFEK